MRDMYTVVDIEQPRRDSRLIESDWFNSIEFFEPLATEDAGTVTIRDSTKYEIDGLREYAEDYTEKFPGATVRIHEEWFGDGGPSISEAVYRGGFYVPAEGRQDRLVPNNLPELVAALEKALNVRGRDSARLGHIEKAARALVEALA